MSNEVCISCRKPKAALNCEICGEYVCKACEMFLDEGTFSFLKTIPDDLSHTHYCAPCYDSKIMPELEKYRETLEKAKSIYFFFTTQKMNLLPLLDRAKEKVDVKNCADRDETILRLAFRAAEQGYNAIIMAEVKSAKVRNEGYQTSVWSGVGIPANVDAERIEKRNRLEQDS
jgi:hypothetical protein